MDFPIKSSSLHSFTNNLLQVICLDWNPPPLILTLCSLLLINCSLWVRQDNCDTDSHALYLGNYSLCMKKKFSEKGKLRKIITSSHTVKYWLEEILIPEKKGQRKARDFRKKKSRTDKFVVNLKDYHSSWLSQVIANDQNKRRASVLKSNN